MTNALLKEARDIEGLVDQSEQTKGGERTIAPAGTTPCRFISYIETGSHMAQHEGKDTKIKPMVRLGFVLLGKAHRVEYEQEGETKHFYNTINLMEMPLSSNEKAGFFKLLRKMIAGRSDVKHMSQMLGEAFLVDVVHGKSADGKKTYANLKNDAGEWTIRAPYYQVPNEDGGFDTKTLPVPETTEDLRLLKLGKPSKAQWDSIFIDGTYEKDGKKISKNFLQERVLASSDFVGSALEGIIGDVSVLDVNTEKLDVSPDDASNESENPNPEGDAAATGDDNPLAALGL